MSITKPNYTQVRLNISNDNLRWIREMESQSIDRNSVTNLALNMLRPRIENIGSSNELIKKTILGEKELEY